MEPNLSDTNDDLWIECTKWLTRWDMIHAEHKINVEGSTMADLALILRNGVLLCKLLNKIDPGCVDMKEINLQPAMAQFLCLKNINIFLTTCSVYFDIEPSDLFEDTMLFDLTDFHKVLCTLSKLSLSWKALGKGTQGFLVPDTKSQKDEIMYQSLPKLQHMPHRSLDCDYLGDIDGGVTPEEIYLDLFQVHDLTEPTQPQEKKDYVLRELLDTEKHYLDILNKLKSSFVSPLQFRMKPEDHATVFYKIKELYDVHAQFLVELVQIRTNPNTNVSKIFLQFKDKFLIYGSYCANLNNATALLQQLCDQDDSFNKIIVKYEKDVDDGKFKLKDVLCIPMQRLLKYHLLLEKLMETAKEQLEENLELKRAWEAMKDVAEYSNEVKRDAEYLLIMNNLQRSLVQWDRSPALKLWDYGMYIKDAEVKIKPFHKKEAKIRYIFVFDRCILICKQMRYTQFAYRGMLDLKKYQVKEITDSFKLGKKTPWSHGFLLASNDEGKGYAIFLRSLEVKSQVIRAVREAQDNVEPSALPHTHHNLELYTFKHPVLCNACFKYLKGLISQGYLCDKCRCSYHKECILSSGGCIDTPIQYSDKLWYVGEMNKDTARMKLQNRESGTFLVRLGGSPYDYRLSLKIGKKVSHIRIYTKTNPQEYYLSESNMFSALDDLVLYYENNSLKESFCYLDGSIRLLYPYRQLTAIILKERVGLDACELTVREGELLAIIGTDGYQDEWWKGRTEDDRVGYVPVEILKVDGEVNFDCACATLANRSSIASLRCNFYF